MSNRSKLKDQITESVKLLLKHEIGKSEATYLLNNYVFRKCKSVSNADVHGTTHFTLLSS